jgi:hypothetical protein
MQAVFVGHLDVVVTVVVKDVLSRLESTWVGLAETDAICVGIW